MTQQLPGPEEGGFLLVDKPQGWTSFDVVGKLRGALKARFGHRVKVGHGGTLDPLATGLLVLGYGPYTRKLQELAGSDKTYEGEMTLGAVTPSYDLETDPQDLKPYAHIDLTTIEDSLPGFRGPIMQRPPSFSAKRHQGERAYFKARAGDEVEMDAVPVTIHALEVFGQDGPRVRFRTTVSKGTYIRSLVHDIGQALGCGAYLSGLRRTRVGALDVTDAKSPEDWSAFICVR